MQDAGIETGACYNVKFDLSEICDNELENIRGFDQDNQKAAGGVVVRN